LHTETLIKNKLTIAIPTYNRAVRLDKSLTDLVGLIVKSQYRNQISVLVSNNGSLDDTEEIIERNRLIFRMQGISFKSRRFKSNLGFDANVLACYGESEGQYIWFLSDDDNISPGSIDTIITDINTYKPTVIFYNHDQEPFDTTNPYIKKTFFYKEILIENINEIKKIIAWPKLSSLVVKKTSSGLKVKDEKSDFAHVGLSIVCSLTKGRLLLSSTFTTYPDHDYMENVDFPPYIGNQLNGAIMQALQITDKKYLFENLQVQYIDPLAASLNTLGVFFRGGIVLTPRLRDELIKTIKLELTKFKVNRILDLNLQKESIKFIFSLFYSGMCFILTGKKLMRIRKGLKVNKS